MGVRVISLNWDSTYVITECRDLNRADRWAETHANQLHFIQHARKDSLLQWVGPHMDSTRWTDPPNPEQAKLARMFLLMEEPYV